MSQTALAAYDGSAAARRALDYAADLAGAGGIVAVVNVIPVNGLSARVETVSAKERARQRALLREARAALSRRRVEVVTVPAVGEPLEEILSAARALDATVILAGRGAAGRRRHPFHGSLGVKLAKRAGCDVLLAA
jgi:nucleotide-binding universal stress UspA family protein